jgi:Fe-S-cluster containining protein
VKPFDCRTCGACCCTEVRLEDGDEIPREHIGPRLTMKNSPTPPAETNYRCIALRGMIGEQVRCSIYERRPAICRRVHEGSVMCLAARALFNLPGGELAPVVVNDAITKLLHVKKAR